MELRVGNKYKLVRKIGGGSFGDIYLGVNITNGEEFAVKKKKSFNEQTTLEMQTHLFLSLIFKKFFVGETGACEDKTPATLLRVQAVQSVPGWCGYPPSVLVWRGRGVQHHGDGPHGPVSGRPVPVLQPALLAEDRADVGRSDDSQDRISPFQKFHPQRR